MNKQQAANWYRTSTALLNLGFSDEEIESLRRIQMTLHRWHERECNGEVEVDETTGKAYAVSGWSTRNRYPTANKEAGALKRLAKIMQGKLGVRAYVQGDPRGCALYIVRNSDVPSGGDINSYYSRGIAVCV